MTAGDLWEELMHSLHCLNNQCMRSAINLLDISCCLLIEMVYILYIYFLKGCPIQQQEGNTHANNTLTTLFM